MQLLVVLSLFITLSVSIPLHFEVAMWMGCPDPEGSAYCPAATSSGLCFCQHDFDAINGNWMRHYIFLDSDKYLPKVLAARNQAAYYVNNFLDNYRQGQSGATAAGVFYQEACDSFGGCSNVPKWWMLNEISEGLWSKGVPKYEKYVLDLAKTLSTKYHFSVIVCAPFAAPRDPTHYAAWRQLAKYAYIGIENYVSGKMVRDHKFSLSWLKAQYKASIDAFAKMNIGKSRLFLLESYDNSGSGTAWGRSGISASDWIKVIKLRQRAIEPLTFKGFVAYGFWGNQMKDSWQQRDKYYKAYVQGAKSLP